MLVILVFVVDGSVSSFCGDAITSPFTLFISGTIELFPSLSVVEGTICRTGSGSFEFDFSSVRGTGCNTDVLSSFEKPDCFVDGSVEITGGI
jgi:hypothetical protein